MPNTEHRVRADDEEPKSEIFRGWRATHLAIIASKTRPRESDLNPVSRMNWGSSFKKHKKIPILTLIDAMQ